VILSIAAVLGRWIQRALQYIVTGNFIQSVEATGYKEDLQKYVEDYTNKIHVNMSMGRRGVLRLNKEVGDPLRSNVLQTDSLIYHLRLICQLEDSARDSIVQ
jgi:hypothetical protein